MKNVCLFICALFLITLSVSGQASKRDIEQLRKEIGLTSSIPILKSKGVFPDSKPIRVFLAIKHNQGIEEDFRDWVAKWNKTQAGRHGELQIVTDIADADIAAVQYQYGTAAPVREESVTMKIGKVTARDEEKDKLVLNRAGNSNVRAQSSARFLRRPLYTYLITRGENNTWHLDYSRVDESISGEMPFPESLLRSAIESRLKDR